MGRRGSNRLRFYDGDPEWKLTAVFAMGWIRGFDDEILAALESVDDLIRMNAVSAAGSYRLDEAWPHVEEILTSDDPEKQLLLAAIEAAPNIRPKASVALLAAWTDSDDEDVAEAVDEAMMVAKFESELGLPGALRSISGLLGGPRVENALPTIRCPCFRESAAGAAVSHAGGRGLLILHEGFSGQSATGLRRFKALHVDVLRLRGSARVCTRRRSTTR